MSGRCCVYIFKISLQRFPREVRVNVSFLFNLASGPLDHKGSITQLFKPSALVPSFYQDQDQEVAENQKV